ncbi:ferric uptake regulator, Fur family [Sulfolobus islandicus Y.G.57.14]|jgi:Fe2+ or Zn2+ uptake regulation protein|uniref:Fe2+/Zn2+ uptake regulation protein n=8 Tax=Saccharolobus islandicus TaxID=43080 RepID=M9U629_SACIS|nr:Fur family transcriptional regulator [Sulfolobus islandicus]ACP36950.1 ferric uptake regulator, Fur family [Sulfolobus islandicus M.14.25]ACP44352.1 ferric uptake regulator, Fur family [Sulfolobus islandicus Y.G.57.14]ACP47257.1 ferric uptake regulator, Fur family [Sulfolobus islandicus Y.N.15.51]ACP54087.1 ferric uptake regulator, Fur family [Sulfolobus islandicus M.16.27]ACR40694.1 ferric uptake regulator, Fur family [Sulfolobus islandicus M.16.4]
MEVDLANLLRQRNLKVTPQRIAILKLIMRGGHYSGEQIYEELKKTEPSISLSTVYNTLETLKESGILNSFEANGITWFEINRKPHVNVFCTDSNRIIDLDVEMDNFMDKLVKNGLDVKNVNIIVYADCSKLGKGSE